MHSGCHTSYAKCQTCHGERANSDDTFMRWEQISSELKHKLKNGYK